MLYKYYIRYLCIKYGMVDIYLYSIIDIFKIIVKNIITVELRLSDRLSSGRPINQTR